MGLALSYRVYKGECSDEKYRNIWHCNPEFHSSAVPQDCMFLLMIYPILFQAVYKSIKFQTVCLAWLVNVGFMCLAISINGGAMMSLPTLVLYIPLSLIIILDLQRQNLSYYFLHCHQLWLGSENKRLSHESEVEMRHMIANVAHDLKTVSLLVFSLCFVILSHSFPYAAALLSAERHGYDHPKRPRTETRIFSVDESHRHFRQQLSGHDQHPGD